MRIFWVLWVFSLCSSAMADWNEVREEDGAVVVTRPGKVPDGRATGQPPSGAVRTPRSAEGGISGEIQSAQSVSSMAEKGDATAQYALGRQYEQGDGVGQDYGSAAIWYYMAAQQGLAEAEAQLGLLYRAGRGVPQSDREAAVWLRKAAEQGVARAQSHLGFLYRAGRGVVQDDKSAANWLRRAAEQGDANAQHNLGALYANGQGVPQEDITAHQWLNLAAANGNPVAADDLVLLEKRMTSSEIESAQGLAREWMEKHAGK